VYVTAAEAITGEPVGTFLFALSRSGQVTEASLPDGEGGAARQRVLRAIEALERGDRSPAAEPAACAFCGYRRVGMCPPPGPEGGP